MDLTQPMTPVLEAARAHAREVDSAGAFPHAAVDALRGSGLLGLTLPPRPAAWAAARRSWSRR